MGQILMNVRDKMRDSSGKIRRNVPSSTIVQPSNNGTTTTKLKPLESPSTITSVPDDNARESGHEEMETIIIPRWGLASTKNG